MRKSLRPIGADRASAVLQYWSPSFDTPAAAFGIRHIDASDKCARKATIFRAICEFMISEIPLSKFRPSSSIRFHNRQGVVVKRDCVGCRQCAASGQYLRQHWGKQREWLMRCMVCFSRDYTQPNTRFWKFHSVNSQNRTIPGDCADCKKPWRHTLHKRCGLRSRKLVVDTVIGKAT